MSKTTAATEPIDTRLIVDKLVEALEKVYQLATDDIGDTNQDIFQVIDPILEDYRSKYGKGTRRSTNRTED